MSRRLLLPALLLLALGGGARAEDERPAAAAPDPLDAAIGRAVDYLVESQNADGSWGTPAPTLSDIYAPVPGSQQAFQVASSALALSGLLESGAEGEAVEAAVEAGAAWLIANHAVKRVSPNTLYNTWAHAYALAAFARLLARAPSEARQRAIEAAAALAVKRLRTFEFVEGGWGYYDFREKARRPGRGATSFTTATVLHALRLAADQGIAVPPTLVEEALGVLRITRRPDNAFAYAVRHRLHPQMGVNKVKGSLARTPACLRALLDWSTDAAERRRAEAGCAKALEDLETHGRFLRIARKYPIPHETWYQNSGYFCLYGYHYAASILPVVPPAARKTFAAQIAGHVRGMQEKDGSFWDYQLFGFHKAYGTGYALFALARCRAALAEDAAGK